MSRRVVRAAEVVEILRRLGLRVEEHRSRRCGVAMDERAARSLAHGLGPLERWILRENLRALGIPPRRVMRPPLVAEESGSPGSTWAVGQTSDGDET